MKVIWTCLYVVVLSGAAFAQQPDDDDERLIHLLEQADQLRIEVVGDAAIVAERHPAPLLRYTNPLYRAQSDGALLMWVDDGVPIALASYSIRNEKDLFRELVTVSKTGLRCQRERQLVWSPQESGFARRDIPGATKPPDNPRLRLSHMKRFADRISVQNMRRLATPLYRYSSKKHGVIDGAVFALVRANDPELLVLVEAHQDGEVAKWRYCMARMNSSPNSIALDGQEIWSWRGYWTNPRRISDPYVEQWDSSLPKHLSRTAGEQN